MVLFADRNQYRLHRREPKWKRPGVVFNQDSDETLHRTEQRAMDHIHRVFLRIRPDVGNVKPPWKSEVKLNRSRLPFSSNCINQFNIDLGPVKDSFSLLTLIIP